jgi:hypothetical protein
MTGLEVQEWGFSITRVCSQTMSRSPACVQSIFEDFARFSGIRSIKNNGTSGSPLRRGMVMAMVDATKEQSLQKAVAFGCSPFLLHVLWTKRWRTGVGGGHPQVYSSLQLWKSYGIIWVGLTGP